MSVSSSTSWKQRLPSTALALAVQGGVFALLLYSFEQIRRAPQPEREVLLTLPRLRPAVRPVIIDARGVSSRPRPSLAPPVADAAAPPTLAPPAASDNGEQTVPQAPGRTLDKCRPGAPYLPPAERALCPPLLKPPDTDAILLNPPSDVKDPERWEEELAVKNSPLALPGSAGGILGIIGTLLLNPGAYGDKRNWSR